MSRGAIGILGTTSTLEPLVLALRSAGFTVHDAAQPSDVVLTSEWPNAALRTEPVVAIVPREEDASAIAEGATDVWTLSIPPRLAAARLDNLIARRTAEASRDEAEVRTRALLTGASDGLWLWDHTSDELTLSAEARRELGLEASDARSLSAWFERIHQDDRGTVHAAFEAHRAGDRDGFEVEHRVRAQDGQWRWLRVRARTVSSADGRALCSGGSLLDITSERGADPATGLPNAERFGEALALAMERARRRAGTVLGVARIRLDGWASLRASLGPLRAEPLLRQAAASLSTCVRAVDTVARFGESEFAVLLEHVVTPRNALTVARRLLSSLAFNIESDAEQAPLAPSVGLATTGPGCSSPAELLAEAGAAAARASEHQSGIEFYDHVVHCRAVERLELEDELAVGIRTGQLSLCYQPVVDLRSGATNGFEALVRWSNPRHGRVAPSTFIPIAEETGLIRELGLWVLRAAIAEASTWAALTAPNDPPCLSVNVSPRQLEDDTFVASVHALLTETRFPARLLELELTESVLMDDRVTSISRLAALRAIGVNIAIDDFGTGHSTLGYLHQLPATKLKIDQSFVRPIEPSSGRPDFVRSLVMLAHDIGLAVVAEGVETAADRDRLAALGCDLGQGYFFAEPLTAEAARAFLLSAP